MRINGLRCDVCKKEHLFNSFRTVVNVLEELPDGWLLLFYDKYDYTSPQTEPLLFCSNGCLHMWVRDEGTDSVEPADKRRLILTLSEDILTPDYLLEKRVDALLAALKHVFPGILGIMTEKKRLVGRFNEMLFILRDAHDKHVEWAKSAKACGLIDSYIYDYDPED